MIIILARKVYTFVQTCLSLIKSQLEKGNVIFFVIDMTFERKYIVSQLVNTKTLYTTNIFSFILNRKRIRKKI